VIHYRADWLLPIADAPMAGGTVSLDNGRIVAVGAAAGAVVDLGRAVILPGLVNAHTHLELSYLHGEIAPSPRFGEWVQAVLAARRQLADPSDARIIGPARRAIADARAAGTALVGDVGNTLATVALLREARMPAQVFYELLGFTEPDPEGRVRTARAHADDLNRGAIDVRVSLAPHAPYSVSAGLFQAIHADLDAHADAVSSVHLGEPAEEIELLRHGTGPIRAVLEGLGRWPSDWRPPGVAPVQYLAGLGVLDARTLVVHGVQFDGEDLTTLRTIGATVVSCPRSNVHVGVGSPPLEVFYAMDVDVAFGTDSLASVADLNLFAELAEARRLAPRVRARQLLESATSIGARALGRERDFGSIEVGKRAALIAVRVPEGVGDVEEYLVGGIEPGDIMWLDSTPDVQRPTSRHSQGPTPT
jgi:cytosine/adenosine deaminase-related metal-dependent hydrolase